VSGAGLLLGVLAACFFLWLNEPTEAELRERERERLHQSEEYRRQVAALHRLRRQAESDLA
jgi:hypothetical protein